MEYTIALISGDGIGPEVSAWAVKALEKAAAGAGIRFIWKELPAGGCAIDVYGVPLPDATLKAAQESDAVLLGAVGGPAWDGLPGHLRPERALLGLRKGLGVYANLRPALLYSQLRGACPLTEEVLAASGDGGKLFDLMIVRELTGGIYFGENGRGQATGDAAAEPAVSGAPYDYAFDTEKYSRFEVERVLHIAFNLAQKRQGRLCMVDKANVLESSRFWREITQELSRRYPSVEVSYMYVDNAAMQLVLAPRNFDVLVTSNLFGDILSDEAAAISGSIGMLASASIGGTAPDKRFPAALYEPIHGSAPDLAGKNLANPLAAILSAALMLRYSFGLEKEASLIEKSVEKVLTLGYRTKDLMRGSLTNVKPAGTEEMGAAVLQAME
ncbi:MAG: 3-isopropylmalate dehydrogenase [Spirochaetaceae bacterium]|jgi:3-isopropylmalate dehydrogenase|nr:3-isopropylmalate dehydrogenase [Spirochaetaceae bacterium]